MKSILSILLFSTAVSAETVTHVHCEYSFMNVPLSSSELDVMPDGTPDSFANVTMSGQAGKFTTTPETLAADELVHVWLSKEQPDTHIEMITFKEAKDGIQSKMINHDIPIGQEMSGPCTITSIDR